MTAAAVGYVFAPESGPAFALATDHLAAAASAPSACATSARTSET